MGGIGILEQEDDLQYDVYVSIVLKLQTMLIPREHPGQL
jgi:hypothetical protein